MRNAFTVDLEDWYHPELVRGAVAHADRESQIEQSTRLLLRLLRERDTHATFFVVGEIAQRHPRLIEEIVEQGHELACHGTSHKPLWQLTPSQFLRELQEFSEVMDEVAPGAEIWGFRAPTFSLDNRTRWALSSLAEQGYRYDSSVFPIRTPLYGVSNCPLAPYRPSLQDISVADEGGSVVEFPMSIWVWKRLRVPVCGGFYLRALPFGLIRYCLRQINQQRPFTIYVHPWEAYADTPRLALPLLSRFATYYNIGGMESRLVDLLDEFSFAPMKSVLEQMGEWTR